MRHITRQWVSSSDLYEYDQAKSTEERSSNLGVLGAIDAMSALRVVGTDLNAMGRECGQPKGACEQPPSDAPVARGFAIIWPGHHGSGCLVLPRNGADVARERLEVMVRWKSTVVVTTYNTSGDFEDSEDLDNLALQAIQRDRRWGSRELRHYEVDIRRHDSNEPPFTWVPRLDVLPPES